jgi:hypothetical protein
MVLSAWLIIYFTERLSISLRKTGKRLHAIYKPGLWPREVQSLPAPSCIIWSEEAAVVGGVDEAWFASMSARMPLPSLMAEASPNGEVLWSMSTPL